MSTTKCLILVAVLAVGLPFSVQAHHPKTHIYTALQIINDIELNASIELNGERYPISNDLQRLILTHRGAFIAGAVGPDAFPDIEFGQMIIHPDRRCDYSSSNQGDCDYSSDVKTWSYEWIDHIFRCAESAPDRTEALAFAYGFLVHAAGDMWGHTFANEYAGGSWPDSYASAEDRKRIIRHVLVESVIKESTPDIVQGVADAGGLGVSPDFLYKTFIDNDWARSHGNGSFITLLEDLRDILPHLDPGQPSEEEIAYAIATGDVGTVGTHYIIHRYVQCWIAEFDAGLKQWPHTSIDIARSLFVNDDTEGAITCLKNYYQQHLVKMANTEPDRLFNSCVLGLPDWVITVLNPADVINDILSDLGNDVVSRLTPVREIANRLEEHMFETAFGISPDDVKEYLRHPRAYFDVSAGFFPSGTLSEIDGLMGLQSGSFNKDVFAPVKNTIVLGKLALLSPMGLDQLLFQYHVGNIYTSPSYLEPGKKINVLRGFIKSFDGNHQWRTGAPPEPNHEANRSFGTGMPLWEDFLARKNFFKIVFRDWVSNGHSVAFRAEDAAREISKLPSVTVFGLTQRHLKANECQAVRLQFRVINHQRRKQEIVLCTTLETSGPLQFNIHDCARIGTVASYAPFVSPMAVRGAPANVTFLNIIRDTLDAALDKITVRSDTVILPNCYSVVGKVKTYVLAKLFSPEHPLSEHNTVVEPNEQEGLNDAVTSLFENDYQVVCEPAVCAQLPMCGPNVARATEPVDHTGLVTPDWITQPPSILPTPCREPGCHSFSSDVDNDSVSNFVDNCPLVPNRNQLDSDGDNVGNVCDQPFRPITVGPLRNFASMTGSQIGILESIAHMLRESGLVVFPDDSLPVAPGPSPGPFGNTGKRIAFQSAHFTVLESQYRELTKSWVDRKISDQELLRAYQPLNTGLYIAVEGYRARGLGLARPATVSGRSQLRLDLEGSGDATLRVVIPRSILDCKKFGIDQKFDVLVDGRKVRTFESTSRNARTLAITLKGQAQNVTILGTTLGPVRR